MPDDGWLGASVGEREERDAALPLTAPVHVVNMYPGTKSPARGYERVPVDLMSWISTIAHGTPGWKWRSNHYAEPPAQVGVLLYAARPWQLNLVTPSRHSHPCATRRPGIATYFFQ